MARSRLQRWIRRCSRADTKLTALTVTCRPAWPVFVVGVLVAQSVLGRLDGALRTKHAAQEVSGGLGDITAPTAALDPEVPVAIVSGWRDVEGLLWGYLAADIIMMSLLAGLLLLLRVTLLDWLGGDGRYQRRLRAAARSRDRQLATAAASALRWSTLAVLGYLAADLVETVMAVGWGLSGTLPRLAAMAIGGAALLKWASLVLAVIPMVLVCLGIPVLRRRAFAGLTALRGHVLIAVVLIAVFLLLRGDIGRQIDDVVAHAAESPSRALGTTLLAMATSLVMIVGGRRCLAAYRSRPDIRGVRTEWLWRTGGIAAAVATGGLLLSTFGPQIVRPTALALLTLPGVAVLVWTALTAPKGVRQLEIVYMRPDPPSPPMTWVWLLGSVPLLILLLAVVRAATTVSVVQGEPAVSLLVWGGSVALALFVAMVLRAPAGPAVPQRPRSAGAVTSVLKRDVTRLEALCWTAAALGLITFAAFRPVGLWMGIGSVAVVYCFALIGTLLAVGLTLLGDALAPRGALALTGLRRMPVMTLLVLWGLVASVSDTQGRYYDAPLVGAGTEVTAPPSRAEPAATALTAWTQADPDERAAPGEDRSLVFITASGGGIRAAYWTQLVWDCFLATHCDGHQVRDQDRSHKVFLASGVSGGAVGLSLVRSGTTPQDARGDVLNKDFLAPALAAALSRDLPNSILRLPLPGHDRAAVLADALATADAGLETTFAEVRGTPHLALSGTSVEDGCRLTLSTVSQGLKATRCGGVVTGLPDEGPDASPVRDALAFLCDRAGQRGDIALADAALLSARFPYVSPTAALHSCFGGGETTYVLDGGMFDNSGGSSVSNVLAALAQPLDAHNDRAAHDQRNVGVQQSEQVPWHGCVIPRLLVIENQFASDAQPVAASRPLQTLGPGQALLSFYDDRSDRELARAAADIERSAERAEMLCSRGSTQGETGGDTASVVVVHPVEAGGAAAPLGWTLADSTRRVMAEQVPTDCSGVPVARPSAADDEVGPDEDGRAMHRIRMCAALRTVDTWLDPVLDD